MPTKILKDMCRVVGHEWMGGTFACIRCNWVPVYGVTIFELQKSGTMYGDNMRRPGEGYSVQHRTVVFDLPIAQGVQFDILIGEGSPWGVQTFVGDGIRRGFRIKP